MAIPLFEDDELNKGIDFNSLPSIDLRQFGGDELRLMAQFSGYFPDANFSDMVVPKVDRLCFNESAGSRKQTYSNWGSNSKHYNRGLGPSATSVDIIHGRSIGLRNSSGVRCCVGEVHIDASERIPNVGTRLNPDNNVTERSLASHVARKRVSTCEVMWKCRMERKGNWTWDDRRAMEIFGGGEDLQWAESKDWKARKAKDFEMAREGRLSGDVTIVAVEERCAPSFPIQCPVGIFSGIITLPLSRKKLKQSIEVISNIESEEAVARLNRKRSASQVLGEEGSVRAKSSRGSFPDTVGGSLFESRHLEFDKRPGRAQKLTGERDMMERLARMKGKWSSSAMTRKVVRASGFPVGWTVSVGLRCTDGQALFEYRDWRSPDGILWSSFKDASAFLLSSIAHRSTSGIMVLLKPGRGKVGGEGISAAKKESTNEKVCGCSENLVSIGSVAALMGPRKFYSVQLSETLEKTGTGKGHVHGRFCSMQVSRVKLDQSVGGCPSVDKIPNFTRVATPVGVAIHADKIIPEVYQRQISNKGKTRDSGQSRCYILSRTPFNTSVGRQRCRDHSVEAPDPSEDADLRELPENSYLGSSPWRIESCVNSCRSKIEGVQRNADLVSSIELRNKCFSCGMILRGHWRRADHGRQVKSGLCGRHVSSIASLLCHGVKMGHPPVTRVTFDSRRVQAHRSDAVSKLRDSKMSNIVLGLLGDSNGGFRDTIDRTSVSEKTSSKSFENLRSSDLLNSVNEVVRQRTQKNGRLSCLLKCKGRDFYHRSQSKQRKTALKSCSLLEVACKRRLSRVVGSESNTAMVVRENRGCEAEGKFAVESVFWKLLDN